MNFEDEVLEILNHWLKDCKIRFYYVPQYLAYHCAVYFERFNIHYSCAIPYTPDMDAKKVTHELLQSILHEIQNYFFQED